MTILSSFDHEKELWTKLGVKYENNLIALLKILWPKVHLLKMGL